MAYAERNRQIKKLVQSAFPACKVSVKGHRGTASGWFTVRIDHAPRNWRERQELDKLVTALIVKSGNSPGHFGYDDPGSDYGYGLQMHVNFAPCREKADSHGDDAWKHHLSAEDWDKLQVQ